MIKNTLNITLFSILFFSSGNAQFFDFPPQNKDADKPVWVQRHQNGLAIDDATSYYFGIGVSNDSQEKADSKSREEFAKSIEIKVESIYEENIKEKNNKSAEKVEMSHSELTEISIKGITIGERYYDQEKGTYYALMKVDKDKYTKIIIDELERENERKTALAQAELDQKQLELEKKQQSNIIKEQNAEEKSRHWQEKFKIRSEKRLFKKATLEKNLYTYRSFLNETPPDKVISFRNGQLATGKHTFSLHMGISPMSIENFYYGLQFWKLAFEMDLLGRNNRLERQELAIKYQVLPNSGDFHKTSVSFGYVEFLHSLSAGESSKPGFSPFFALNMTFPELLHSYGSLYADSRKISMGINSYPTYDTFRDKLSILFELNYIRRSGFRNRFNDEMMVQAGVRFKTSDHINTSFTYESHETFVFSADYVF